MSLTAEAYSERKWRPFPILRKAIENKQIPETYFGVTSASDNMFDAMSRLIEIAVLAVNYEKEIREIALSMGREEMYTDLRHLEEALDQASYFFRETKEELRKLYETL